MQIERQGALITGASRGLGRAVAELLAARGARVALVARQRGPLEEVVAAIRARGGIAHAIVGDVADKAAAHAIAGQAQGLVGEVGIAVHNASSLGPLPLRLLLDTDCEDLAAVLETNLVGPFRLTKILAGAMALRGAGTIVHVSSDAAVEPYPTWGAYSIAKAAQDHLSRILAAELVGTGVRVLAVDPRRDGHADARRCSARRRSRVAATAGRRRREARRADRRGWRERRESRAVSELQATLRSDAIAREDVQLVVVGTPTRVVPFSRLPTLLDPGDLVVVNDAATLPASLPGVTARGDVFELRLSAPIDGSRLFGVVLGAGDFHTRTEDRPPPPVLTERVVIAGLSARVVATAGRRVELVAEAPVDELWRAIYAVGAPIQYAHRPEPLPLYAVQTAYAARPWAAEMPSAGRALTWKILLALRRAGIAIATLTHAAGLSSTGDDELDRALPWPERFEIPQATLAAIATATRVIAVGTTVVRALESSDHPGMATLRLDAAYRPRVVDGLISGLHVPGESHFELLSAFAPVAELRRAMVVARGARLVGSRARRRVSDPAEQIELSERGRDKPIRLRKIAWPSAHRDEAAVDKRRELALDPATFGPDREHARQGRAGDRSFEQRRAGMRDQPARFGEVSVEQAHQPLVKADLRQARRAALLGAEPRGVREDRGVELRRAQVALVDAPRVRQLDPTDAECRARLDHARQRFRSRDRQHEIDGQLRRDRAGRRDAERQ